MAGTSSSISRILTLGLPELLGRSGYAVICCRDRIHSELIVTLQHRMLYIFDPDAMHNVIVKDQYIYEEATWFIKCARLRLHPDNPLTWHFLFQNSKKLESERAMRGHS